MKILAVDTALGACSVALLEEGAWVEAAERLERRRMEAGKLLEKGFSPAQVRDTLGVSYQSAHDWAKATGRIMSMKRVESNVIACVEEEIPIEREV